MKSGRDKAITDDVRKAMKESVIPADSKLQRALESGRKGRLSRMLPTSALLTTEDQAPEIETPGMQGLSDKADTEENLPASPRLPALVSGTRNRAGNETSLIEA